MSDRKQNLGLKIYAVLITAAVLVLLALCFRPGQKAEIPGNDKMFAVEELCFETPEEAVQHLIKGLQENDMRTILEAWEITNQKYDFVKTVESIGGFSQSMYWPEEYKLYREMNQINAAQSMVLDLKRMVWSINIPDVEPMMPLSRQSEDGLVKAPAQFERLLDSSNLAELKVERMKLFQASQEFVDRLALQYGVKDIREAAILYSLDGQYYGGSLTLFQTENGWKIHSLTSGLDGLENHEGLTPMTKEEFSELVE